MATVKCPNCGAERDIDIHVEKECPYCGGMLSQSSSKIENAPIFHDKKKHYEKRLFLPINSEFSNAETIRQEIIKQITRYECVDVEHIERDVKINSIEKYYVPLYRFTVKALYVIPHAGQKPFKLDFAVSAVSEQSKIKINGLSHRDFSVKMTGKEGFKDYFSEKTSPDFDFKIIKPDLNSDSKQVKKNIREYVETYYREIVDYDQQEDYDIEEELCSDTIYYIPQMSIVYSYKNYLFFASWYVDCRIPEGRVMLNGTDYRNTPEFQEEQRLFKEKVNKDNEQKQSDLAVKGKETELESLTSKPSTKKSGKTATYIGLLFLICLGGTILWASEIIQQYLYKKKVEKEFLNNFVGKEIEGNSLSKKITVKFISNDMVQYSVDSAYYDNDMNKELHKIKEYTTPFELDVDVWGSEDSNKGYEAMITVSFGWYNVVDLYYSKDSFNCHSRFGGEQDGFYITPCNDSNTSNVKDTTDSATILSPPSQELYNSLDCWSKFIATTSKRCDFLNGDAILE